MPLAACLVAAAPAPTYQVSGTIAGPDGGWDYANVDADSNRLFVAHGETVATVDLAAPSAMTTFGPAHHAHAVVPIPGSGLLLVTDGDTGTARLVEIRTGAERATIKVGEKPDAAIWDAKHRRVVVMNSKSGTVMMIDPATATVTGTATLAPKLEAAAVDKRGVLFVNNEAQNLVYVIAPETAKVLGTITLPGCEGPSGMAYAPKADRILVACANRAAAVIAPVARTVEKTLEIGAGPDAVIGDATHGRLFIPSGGDGTLTLFADTAAGIVRTGVVKTEIGARTGAVDPRTGIVYLPTSKFGPPATAGGKPVAVPGTFHVVVVKPGKAA
ncbi:gluconolactonase [Sphingomonas nostoxanthinifaciens]|nr:gluconolactonase [Sphingomonas nostoxanthinifaciens]